MPSSSFLPVSANGPESSAITPTLTTPAAWAGAPAARSQIAAAPAAILRKEDTMRPPRPLGPGGPRARHRVPDPATAICPACRARASSRSVVRRDAPPLPSELHRLADPGLDLASLDQER